MISMKIFYILLLLGAFIFYIMYIDILALILLVFLILMPIVSFGLFLYSRKKVDISLKTASESVSKNDAIILNLIIDNKSYIPFSKAEIEIKYKNDLLNVWESYVVTTNVRALSTQKVSAVIKSEFCGSITAKIDSIKLYDLLLLFKKKYKAKSLKVSKTIVNSIVFPEIRELDFEVSNANIVDYESDFMSKTQKGDDPSEIFDIHEYVPGDKLNRIHWKLSAKSEETYVKDFSLPVNNNTCLLFDSKIKNKSDLLKSLRLFDICIEGLLSFSYSLCENEVIHSVVCYNDTTDEFEKKVVTDFDECRYAVYEILKNKNSEGDKSVICSFLDSEEGRLQKVIYFTPEITKAELDYISERNDDNITIICADEIAYDCYPIKDNVRLILVKNGNISESVLQLKI